MEYDRAVADVMRGQLKSFAARRSETVRELRRHGEAHLAERIARLRKPSVALWALNHAAAVASEDVAALRAAGERLRRAQEDLLRGKRAAESQLAEATNAQRVAVDTVCRRLGMVLSAEGYAASQETLRRLSEMLRTASIADGETWRALEDGRLLAEPEAATFGVLNIGDMRRVTEKRAEQETQMRRTRLAAAQEQVRRAEDAERTAKEQEAAARQRREEAENAVRHAREALAQLEGEPDSG